MTVLQSDEGKGMQLQFETLCPFKHIERVKEIWMKMLVNCQHSYFTSWGWISTWLASLPRQSDIQLIVGRYAGEPMIAFFAGRKKGLRYGFLPSRTYSLNSTGDSHLDQLFIEYNSILIAPGIFEKITDLLSPLGVWDEIILPGASLEFVASMKLLVGDGRDFFPLVDKTESSYSVDLQKIRDAGMDFLALLSSNRRSQIRRSVKQYELDGKVQVREPEHRQDALAMFDNLVNLHQQEWQKRARPGAFANLYFYQFHKDLVANRFDAGEIQILQVHNDKMDIGYLYNFVYQQNILFYQSGFNYTDGNVYRPGLVSHYLGILYNTAKGFSVYDFLAGEAQYKASLATNTKPMYWIRLFKKESRFNFERRILGLKRRLSSTPKVMERLKQIKFWLESKR